ncbi:condensin subunit Smc [Seinonella peptonophila]|uniref:Chromosome partition protein Smc n=1 Tax=Seinonella peptonophila TaxID=112248 RepID=A0A1M4UT86_9BACL|nr:chromosome segregation protein SMC [Seinonella peptonophila]SHE59894.1 condensin subunit Smc [Seinonella peptonophila]
MYLKRLEMSGFKSFANRTEFKFVPGITAIVGPNGSGKSNVTDGIRWVLGEQSARSLRGAKMEDVIFAGSSDRKPVGFCEVSITFDNSEQRLAYDYPEITVTRRVYRSGESEYLLNKQPCRLKDINELFMDTGIGKEAYSVISQGKIDDILSTKSEDRRAIFEEAAGIVKYKTRKKDAQKKLEMTEQNLTRIHDLIHELEQQIEPLTEQAKVAEQYKDWKSELKNHEIGLYIYKIQQLRQDWEKSKSEVAALSDRQMSSAAELAQKEALLAELKEKLHQTEQAWENQQADLLAASEAMERAEASQRVFAERVISQKQTKEHVSVQLKQLNDDLDEIAQEREQLRSQLVTKQTEYTQAQQKLQEITEKLEKQTEATDEVDDQLRHDIQTLENRQSVLENELHHLFAQKKMDEGLKAKQDQELERWREKKYVLQVKKDELEQQLTTLEEERKRLRELEQKLRDQLQEHLTEEQQLRQEGDLLQKKLTQLQSRYESLKEIQESREGFFYGVKEILRARDQGESSLSLVYGAVAELIEVEPRFEQAIEIALGAGLQHIIVANEDTGRAGIQYLKRNRLGRATFLPLDVIQARTIPRAEFEKASTHPAWVGIAADLVRYDPSVQAAIYNLLGNIIIAENLTGAQQLASRLRYRYRIVTLEGDVVNPGGSMAGGSQQKSKSNILSRSRQLVELESELQQGKKRMSAWKERLQSKEQFVLQIRQQMNDNQLEKEKQNEQHREFLAKQREYQLEQNHITERLQQLIHQQQQSVAQQINYENKRSELEKEYAANEEALQERSQQLSKIEQQQSEIASAKEEFQVELVDAKVYVAELRQELEHHQQGIERLERNWQRTLEQRRASESQLQETEQITLELSEQRDQIDQEFQAAQQKKQQVSDRVQEIRQSREAQLKEREEQEYVVRQLERQLKKEQDLSHQQEVRMNRLDVELNHCLQKLAEEYELSYERAAREYPIPEEPNKVERLVRSLKQRIAALGEVNLGAIEEYSRLQERFDFLQTQEKDLLEAKQRLYDMITQIEQEMGVRFSEAFTSIRAEFQEVFVQMFGGGQADLRLTEPEKLLETGIEIVAQPPGKRLQNLSLLSGGERALAAIALLFAVLRIKPVPFCVLDEVDAALDEVNLSRFTRYMQEFSHHTQFIIITHRKRTMEGADVLYGITMQESGVSSLVSVQMEALVASEKQAAVTRETQA